MVEKTLQTFLGPPRLILKILFSLILRILAFIFTTSTCLSLSFFFPIPTFSPFSPLICRCGWAVCSTRSRSSRPSCSRLLVRTSGPWIGWPYPVTSPRKTRRTSVPRRVRAPTCTDCSWREPDGMCKRACWVKPSWRNWPPACLYCTWKVGNHGAWHLLRDILRARVRSLLPACFSNKRARLLQSLVFFSLRQTRSDER